MKSLFLSVLCIICCMSLLSGCTEEFTYGKRPEGISDQEWEEYKQKADERYSQMNRQNLANLQQMNQQILESQRNADARMEATMRNSTQQAQINTMQRQINTMQGQITTMENTYPGARQSGNIRGLPPPRRITIY